MSSVVWLLESAADTLGYQPGYIPTYPERVKNPKKPSLVYYVWFSSLSNFIKNAFVTTGSLPVHS
jgi:hypothetical protein